MERTQAQQYNNSSHYDAYYDTPTGSPTTARKSVQYHEEGEPDKLENNRSVDDPFADDVVPVDPLNDVLHVQVSYLLIEGAIFGTLIGLRSHIRYHLLVSRTTTFTTCLH